MTTPILKLGKATLFSSYPDWLSTKTGPNYNKTYGPAHRVPGASVPTNQWFSPLFWWVNDLDFDQNPNATFGTQGMTVGKQIPLRAMPNLYQVCPWGLMVTYRPNPEISCGDDGSETNCGWPQSQQPMGCSNQTYWQFYPDPNAIYSSLVISVDQLLVNKPTTPFFVKPTAFGDWDVTAQWDDGQRQLQLNLMAGSPGVFGQATGGELELQLPVGDPGLASPYTPPRSVTFYNSQGVCIGEAYDGIDPSKLPDFSSVTDGAIAFCFQTKQNNTTSEQGDKVYYAVFAPQGTQWAFSLGTLNVASKPGRYGYLSSLKSTNLAATNQPIPFTVVTLPSPPQGVNFPLKAFQAFAKAAGYGVTQTVFTWDSWDTQTGTITAHHTFQVANVTDKIPSQNPSLLTCLFKPQQTVLGTQAPYLLDEQGNPYCYNSPRGPLKLIQLPVVNEQAQYSVTYPYYGYVPVLPDPGFNKQTLKNFVAYLTADSSQTSQGITDFLTESAVDAYSTGTMIYYKISQMVLWLQQCSALQSIPKWRNGSKAIAKQEAIQLLINFLKADLENFFSATRPANLAYQWHYAAASPSDVSGFSQTTPTEPVPTIFPCPGNAQCNPPNDPLRQDLQTGPYWKLSQQDLINAQKQGVNPYLVFRGLDFTVNAITKTGPSVDNLMHFAWKQGNANRGQNINLYVFFAPTAKKANPKNLSQWQQCVWTQEGKKGKIFPNNNVGVGGWQSISPADSPWRLGNLPYNGTSSYSLNTLAAGVYDILLVFDCGASCANFPVLCGNGTIPPNVADPSWNGWEMTLGPIHFGGKAYKFLAYDPNWNTLLGNYSWYGSTENLNDHHFGWGYLIQAAALVAQFDTTLDPITQKPWWDLETGWGGIVNLMIRDVMDWRKPDEADPFNLNFVRCKYLNPVEGHMYADGNGNSGDGNNEESSSEALNFANACIQWGTVTNQDDIRDLGILLRSLYSQAIPVYWFNRDGDVLPSTSATQPFPVAGQIFGSGNKHDTFFSGNTGDKGCQSRNSDVVAIQTLPVTGGTLGLTLFTPQLQVAWQTVTNAGGPYCAPNNSRCYLSTLLCYQSLFDATTANQQFLTLADPTTSVKTWYNSMPTAPYALKQPNDHSYAATYGFITSLAKWGAAKAVTVASPDGNPFYQPLANGSVLVYNYQAKSQTYRINNQSVTIPPLTCVQV